MNSKVGAIGGDFESFAKQLQKELDELRQYRALGTVEELREAKEKQIPKKVVIRKNESVYMPDRCYCPICGKQQKRTYKNVSQGCYCERCGQRLEWSE